jgi:hypothetical protein
VLVEIERLVLPRLVIAEHAQFREQRRRPLRPRRADHPLVLRLVLAYRGQRLVGQPRPDLALGVAEPNERTQQFGGFAEVGNVGDDLARVLFGASATVPPTTPDRLRTPPPNASLGPRYTITYTVPGVTPRSGEQFGKIRQELYPHAANGPVIYTPPGQAGFGQPLQVTGWLRATPRLTRTLARLGVPRRAAPVPRAHVPHAVDTATAHQAGSGALPWLIGAAAAIVAAVLAAALLLRHRKSATVHHSEPRTGGPAAGSA